MSLTRGDIHWIDSPERDPKGAEIEKRRSHVILSLTGVNAYRKTVVVVPLTTKQKDAPPILISLPSGASIPRPSAIRFSLSTRGAFSGKPGHFHKKT